jgi:GTP-binding protein
MQFVDEASIRIEAGNGGRGTTSFRREKYVPLGGPDGGDGGDGGDVVLVADGSLNTLVDFRYQPLYRAASGEGGGGANRSGARGANLEVRVPAGTTVIDDETLEILGDLAQPGTRLMVARGGQGGRGNARFKTSTNRAPRRSTPGAPGEARKLRLQLKVLADVGLLGMPNAGKSTLLARVSASRPKIADYPFTTLTPNLGVVRVDGERSFVLADIPGLIEGAAEGAGLGTQFLRHLSRCRLLVHLVEIAPLDGSDPLVNLRVVEAELERYSTALLERPIWIVITKLDLLPPNERAKALTRFRRRLRSPSRRVFGISAVEGAGVDELLRELMGAVERSRAAHHNDAKARARNASIEERVAADVLKNSLEARAARRRSDSPDDGVEVIYRA